MKRGLIDLFERYIKGTIEKAIVADKKFLICHLCLAAFQSGYFKSAKVYITTRALKHMYDKKPAEEFLFLIENLYKVVKIPDSIYRNKKGKRGDYCLIKNIKGDKYLCCLEKITFLDQNGQEIEEIQIATAFRVRNEDYLKSYELLWEWKGGDLHRNAFDSDVTRPNSTPQ